MKTVYLLFFGLLTLVACRNPSAGKPVWLNQTAVLALPAAMYFGTDTGNWQASLLSFSQPIPLAVRVTATGFMATLDAPAGVLEGPAQLCVWSGEQYFYYPVELRNGKRPVISPKDYRSPKTVNPDSSLTQQGIREAIDSHRNLMPVRDCTVYFAEDERRLAPKVGTFRAIRDEAQTAYYVQPGSCTRIPIRAAYKSETNSYFVTVGPLADKHANPVADGTHVEFVYTGGPDTYRMEATVLHGYATALIPADKQIPYRLSARIANTVSTPITLTY